MITRRDLGRLAAAGALAAQGAKTAISRYKGPLDGYGDKVNLPRFRPGGLYLERYRSAPLKLTFKSTSRKEAEVWQKKLRTRLSELAGGFPYGAHAA